MNESVALGGVSLPGTPLFRARGITKVYYPGTETEVRALDGVDLDLYEGELAVLLGASGSGKSTLLNILGGLDVPSEGTLSYRDEELAGADERQLTLFRRNVAGFVFQFYNLIPSLTARENVALITEIALDPMAPEEALALVGLSDRMDHFPSQLSGGQQQRVAIARALVHRPAIVVADEPTGNLDEATGAVVADLLFARVADVGATLMLVTHDPDLAARCDRVIHVRAGRVVDEVRA